MSENFNRANSSFSSAGIEDKKTMYMKAISFDKKSDPTSLWNDIVTDRRDYEQYKILAYTNDSKCNYTLQFQNNVMVPVYLHNTMSLPLYAFKRIKDLQDKVVLIIESFTINDTMQLKNIMEYYKNTPLHMSDNEEENIISTHDILRKLSSESFPAVMRVMHLINLDVQKHNRRIYVPNLNVVIYKGGNDLKYAGEHPKAKYITNDLNVIPKNSREDINLYQYYFKIINNEEINRKYYIRVFNQVLEIESTPSLDGTEKSCVKIASFQEQRQIDKVIKEGLSDENLKELGIYKSRAEAEAVHDITKIIESKKIDLELNRLQNSNTDALFKSKAMKDSMELALRRNQLDGKKIELDGKKVELEYEKLDLDRSKLILDKERLELEFNKVLKDIHILERGYRHDVSKLNIGIIKEITDSISIVMKLVTLGKSLFSGD